MGTLKLKLQLLHNGEIAMGPGKAELLDAIEATGSISAAARAMGMSYRRAWLLVDTMNRAFDNPLNEIALAVHFSLLDSVFMGKVQVHEHEDARFGV